MSKVDKIDSGALSDGRAAPAQRGGKLNEEEHVYLPDIKEAKPEVITRTVKVALAHILEDPKVLAKENDQALLNLHLRLHQLWTAAKAGKLAIATPDFIKVHTLVIDEMDRRGMQHSPTDEIDQASQRKRTRKFAGAGYNEAYYAGLRDADALFVSDMAEVLKWMPDDAGSVLELGSGMGRALDVLKSSGMDADGLELSEYAAGAARQRGHEVVLGDASELPFTDGLYDVVFSMHVLEHITDFDKALTESARVASRKAIHIIPLGVRRDPSHKHTFKTLDDLRKRVVALNLGCAQEFHRTKSNHAVVVLDKGMTDVSPVTSYLQDFVVIKDFLSLAGGAVKSSNPDDIDIVWRADESIGGMELAFRNLFPQEVRDRLHHIYNSQGPHDDYLPLYDLVAVKRTPLKLIDVEKTALKPLKMFTPLKTAGGYTQQEFFTPDEFWEQWAKPFIEEGTRLAVEIKFNGYRTVAQYDGKDTLVYFEDSKTDRSAQLLPVVADLKVIGKPVILDLDLGAVYTESGDVVPRVELSGLISHDTKVADDGTFQTPDGKDAKIVCHVFHLLYIDDKDLHTLPWIEMRPQLEHLMRGTDFTTFKLSKVALVLSKQDLLRAVSRVSKEDGSEGAMVKVTTSDYPLTGQTTAWAKIKNLLEFKVEVIDRTRVHGSSSSYNYRVGYKDDNGKLREMGKTFNTMVDAKPGDVLTLSAEEVIPAYNEADKTWTVSAVVPRVEDLETGEMQAEGVRSIINRAYKANVLQVNPDVLDALHIAGLAKRDADGEQEQDKVEIDILVKQEGILSFKEGDSGTGVLQTHERGISEEQTKLTHDFGWEPVAFTEAELGELSHIAGKDVTAAYKQAQEGSSAALGTALKDVDAAKLSHAQRVLVARAEPVSIHTDFRMRPGEETYWEGGEGFTPGNQYKSNKWRQIADGDTPDAKILMNFKVARVGNEEVTLAKTEPVRGPIAWMTIGRGTPKVFPPGAVGSTADAFSRFLIRDQFKWRAGVQDRHYKEFEFDGRVLKGRWVFQFVPVGHGDTEQAGGRAWMMSRPGKQTFDSAALNKGLTLAMPILKRDDAKHIVEGIVLKPDTTDAQGDIIDRENVETAAHKFLLGYRRGNVVGYMHRDMGRDLYLVESYIAPVAFTLNGHKVPEGSWVMAVKVLDMQTWKEVAEGRINGFSIGGIARVHPIR